MKTSSIETYGIGTRIKVSITIEHTEPNIQQQQHIDECLRKLTEELIQIGRDTNQEHLEYAEKTVQNLTECFELPIYVERVSNEYNPTHSIINPWLIVTTKKGRIKIGWRKRVINIDWSDSAIHDIAPDLFPKEDVTKYDKVIHAWGYGKAKEYISTLME